MSELRDLVRSIIQDEFEEIHGIQCIVSNVREDDTLGFVCDATPINGKSKIVDVRLQAAISDGVLIVPSDNSVIFVVMESDTEAFVSMFGKIDRIKLFDGENSVPISEEMAKKLNALEDAMKNHIHTSAAPGSPTTPATNVSITNTKAEDIENSLFLH